MKTTINTVAKPTVNLTINKSRLKIYNPEKEPTYYLKDGQEFQLELFNPTSSRILAKIELNGNLISQGGIVLRPGERVFLERYLDVAKKFLFETYEVNGSDEEVKAAIQKNGSVKIQFFNEEIILPTFTQHPQYNQLYYYDTNVTSHSNIIGGSSLSNISNNTTFTSSYSSNLDWMQQELSNSVKLSEPTLSMKTPNTRGILKKTKSLKTETGRIETGSDSSQKLKTVDYKFYTYPTHTVEYKILPLSEKVNTTEDIKVKMYCHECGTKTGKGYKFCSQCGTKQ